MARISPKKVNIYENMPGLVFDTPLQRTQPGVSYLPASAQNIPSAHVTSSKNSSYRAPGGYPAGGINLGSNQVNMGTLENPNIVTSGGGGQAAPAGSAAFLFEQSQQDRDAEDQYNDIYNYQREQFEQEIDPNKIYQNTLKRYQAQIDMINNMFNDQLNQSRVTNAPTYKAREDQSRIGQVLGGLVASPMGQAQTNQIQDANAQEQAAAEAIINDKREQAISRVFGLARESAEAELTQKREAKAKGADSLLEYLNAAPERKKSRVSSLVKALIAQGIDPSDLSSDELKKLSKDLGVSTGDIEGAYGEAVSEQKKAELEQRKVEAEVSNLENKYEFEAAQKALDRALEEKRISVSWYNATTSRMAEDRQAAEKSGSNKNYDGATIPEDVKAELVFDLQQNMTAKKKDQRSLQDFFESYPEVNTKYLSELFEANK